MPETTVWMTGTKAVMTVATPLRIICNPSPCDPTKANAAPTARIAAANANHVVGGTIAIAVPKPVNAVAKPCPIPCATVLIAVPKDSMTVPTPSKADLMPCPIP